MFPKLAGTSVCIRIKYIYFILFFFDEGALFLIANANRPTGVIITCLKVFCLFCHVKDKSFNVATFYVTSFIWIKALCRNAALSFLFSFHFKATFQKFTWNVLSIFWKAFYWNVPSKSNSRTNKKVKTLMLNLLGALICSFLRITVNRAVRGPK